MKETDGREMRGRQIADKKGQIERIDPSHYRVASQSGHGFYKVSVYPKNFECSCPDFVNRSQQCKHIWAVKFSQAIRVRVEARREEISNIEPMNVSSCRSCGSTNIVKDGVRHNQSGNIQLYSCRDCGHYFSFNLGFERMRASPQAITGAMQLYYSGESLRNVQKFLALQGVQKSHVAVYKWCRKYTALLERYLDQIKPNVGNTWRADEMYVKFKGNMKYVFAMLDDETRFWIAQEVSGTKASYDATGLFKKSQEAVGKKPAILITDGLASYYKANKKIWGAVKRTENTHHIRNITFKGNRNNNKMERLNGEIRDREKVMRGLKDENGHVLKGYQIYHNYVRPHMALGGKTPAEMCGIKIAGKNKWMTLIQNASTPVENTKSP